MLKIPNVLTLGVFPFLLGYQHHIGGWDYVWSGLLAYFAVILILFVPFVLGGLGAADLKFLANIAIFVGLQKFIYCFAFGIYCMIPALVYFIIRDKERIVHFITTREVMPDEGGQHKFAYTPYFAIGTIIYLMQPETFPVYDFGF